MNASALCVFGVRVGEVLGEDWTGPNSSIKLSTMGAGAFSHAAPKLWNSLPPHIRLLDSIIKFKTALKTHLFKLAYSLLHQLHQLHLMFVSKC